MKPDKNILFAASMLLVWYSASAFSFEEFDERYPKYSVPIYPNEAVIYLNTNPPSQAIRDFRKINVVCTANKSRYFSGENARLSIDIFYKDYSLKSTTIKFSDEYESTAVDLRPKIFGVDRSTTRYYVETTIPPVEETTTYIFNVLVETEQGRVSLNIPVEVSNKMNKILGVDKAVIEQEDISIPVLIENEQTGFYRLTATAFINNVPSARVMQQVHLNLIGRQAIPIKMHKRLIRDRRLYGELELRDIVLEKIPEAPGDIGGKSEPASFVINIPFN